MYHVGIDISKFFHQCFIATAAGEAVKEFRFDNNKSGFKELTDLLTTLGGPKEIKIGFESTGHYHQNLARHLSNLGYSFLEFNPYKTSLFSKALSFQKVKTDKVDAKIISSMLGFVDYQNLHTRFYHINDLKTLVRYRFAALNHRSKELVKLTNLLDLVFPEYKAFFNNTYTKGFFFVLKRFKTKERMVRMTTKDHELILKETKGKFKYPKFVKLKSLAKDSIGVTSAVLDFLIQTTISQYEHLTRVLKSLDEQIVSLYQQSNSMIHTLPGLGLVSAAAIYAEINDINNFQNPQQLIGYAGLGVSIQQSGQSERYGKIVKRGSSLLRYVVYQYAMPSIRFIPTITDFYQKKKSEGKHFKVSLIHISRKLLRIIYHLEKNNKPFDKNLTF